MPGRACDSSRIEVFPDEGKNPRWRGGATWRWWSLNPWPPQPIGQTHSRSHSCSLRGLLGGPGWQRSRDSRQNWRPTDSGGGPEQSCFDYTSLSRCVQAPEVKVCGSRPLRQ
jgi:hypothetical protein